MLVRPRIQLPVIRVVEIVSNFIRIRREGGFTLIEITVAVLIIGVLLTIAVPVFSTARDKARANTCIRNLKTISDAKDQFTMENGKVVGDSVSMNDLVPTYIRNTPECPSGGTYDPLTVGDTVDCSFEGHEL
jgi:general secretion pathway protein G